MPSLTIERRRCTNGHEYERNRWGDGTVSDPADDECTPIAAEADKCPTCGDAQYERLVAPGQGINLNKGGPVSYPYYDETLEAHVESHAHMLRLAKVKGLRPMESRDSFSQQHRSAALREWEKSADEGKAFLERQASEPWYREMQDRIGVKVRDRRTGETTTVFRREDADDYMRAKRPGRE